MQDMSTESTKKNLLLIVPLLHQGGFEKTCVETARILRDDADVTIAIFDDRDRHYDTGDIPVVNLRLPVKKGTIGKAFNLMRRARALRRLKKKKHIDISYSFGMTANLANAMSHAGDLVVTSLHSSIDFETRKRLQKVVRGSDRIVACGRRMQERLQKEYGRDDAQLLYNPHDVDAIARLAKETVTDMPFAGAHPVIVTMGRDDVVKGYWHLIKAFSVLKRTEPEAKLMILGEGAFDRERKLIKDLGLQDDIALTGVKKNPFPYLAASDLFVLTSNREGFPNALIEAMALSLPVIATDCETGPREILLNDEETESLEKRFEKGQSTRDIITGAYGMLIPDMDAIPDYDAAFITPEDRMLENAIKRFLADDDVRNRCRRQAYEKARTYAPAQIRNRLKEILGL